MRRREIRIFVSSLTCALALVLPAGPAQASEVVKLARLIITGKRLGSTPPPPVAPPPTKLPRVVIEGQHMETSIRVAQQQPVRFEDLFAQSDGTFSQVQPGALWVHMYAERWCMVLLQCETDCVPAGALPIKPASLTTATCQTTMPGARPASRRCRWNSALRREVATVSRSQLLSMKDNCCGHDHTASILSALIATLARGPG